MNRQIEQGSCSNEITLVPKGYLNAWSIYYLSCKELPRRLGRPSAHVSRSRLSLR